MSGHQRHHHSLPVHGGPGGREHHPHLCRVPATAERGSAGYQMDLSASGHRSTGRRAPHRPGQHEESSFLWQLHQELPVAQDEADGGEAGEGLRAADLERVGGGPGALHVSGAGV